MSDGADIAGVEIGRPGPVSSGLDVLLIVADAACAGQPVPPDAGRLFCDAVTAVLDGRFPTIDKALGLYGRGKSSLKVMTAIRRRDEIIRQTLIAYSLTSVELEAILRDYQSRCWTRDRILDECPARHAGTVREACWQILKLVDRALSDRQIRSISRK